MRSGASAVPSSRASRRRTRTALRSAAFGAVVFAAAIAVSQPLAAASGDAPAPSAVDRAALKTALRLWPVAQGEQTGEEAEWQGAHPLLDLHAVFRNRGAIISRSPDQTASLACFWAVEPIGADALAEPDRSEVSGALLARRYKTFHESFLNAEDGLRHIVHLDSSDAIDDATLAFRLSTTLTRKLVDGGRTLLLFSGGEWALRYRILEAVDDRGLNIDPRMEIEGDSGAETTLVRIQGGQFDRSSWTRIVGIWDTPKSPFQAPADQMLLAAPANDTCAGAQVIPAAGPFPHRTTTVPDITDATTTGDPPTPSCQPDVSRSVWHRFAPSTSADYTFSVCSNAPTDTTVDDTVLAVYASDPDGDCAGDFTQVPAASPFASCDDDSCTNEDLQSELTVQLESGSTYFIVAWQFGAAAPTPGNTAVQVRVSQANPLPPPPPNDACEGAESIPGAGPFPHLTTLVSDVRDARTTGDPPDPSCAPITSRSVWYTITPTESANYTFSTCADAPTGTTLDDTVVAVYTSSNGSCGGSFSEVAGACDDDSCVAEAAQGTVTVSLQAGVKYYVVVWQRGSVMPPEGQAAVQVRVTKSIPPPPPANDQCGGATTIPDGPFPVTTALVSDITGATTTGDPTAPSCGGALRSRSLWYRFTPSQSASYTISSCSGDGLGTTVDDTVIAVYASGEAGCAGPLTEVIGGCDDDGCVTEDAQSVVTTTLQGGAVYYIVVWQKGVGVPSPGATAVQLRVIKGPLAPANDTCTGAELIADGPYPATSSVTLDITGASTATDPSGVSCQANRSRGIWYRLTPGAGGYYRISTCSGDGTQTTVEDTVVSLYTSPAGCAGPLTEVPTTLCADGCDDDSCTGGDLQSTVTTYLQGGAQYYLLVWKYGTEPPAAGKTAVQVKVDKLPATTPPANDDCAAAATIPAGGPFPYTADLAPDVTSASCAGDPPAPSCEAAVSRSVWHRLTPNRSGLFTFSTCADAPTGTTVDDTVIGVYRTASGCAGPFTEIGCDDDACGSEALQAVASDLRLEAGQTYYIVVWSFGTQPPAASDKAVQLWVDADFTPANDRCEAATPLELDVPTTGTTISATDSYRLAGSACFTGVAQTATTAPGLDVTYAFTAPEAGDYSFKVAGHAVGAPQDVTLYVSSACEAGTPPVTVTSCLAAANRNTSGPSEEVACVPLASGQTVYVTVDNADAAGTGSDFTIEVNRCTRESEPNDATNSAGIPVCGVEGAVSPGGDVDVYALGQPVVGARIFALVDGVAGSPANSDFDLRVTTTTDTLEYDDANNDAEFGNASPNVGGTKATGAPAFLRVTLKSSTAVSEPYRLYAVTQGPATLATPETEPNNTTAAANAADFVSGTLPGPSPSSDIDVYRIQAARGDLWVIGLDGDAGYDGTPLNAKLEILDALGTVLATINDSGTTGNARTPAAGLTSTTPAAPAEGLTFRAPAAGMYYIRVSAGSTGANTSGDYLLSISPRCLAADADNDGIPNVTDCAPETPGAPAPGLVEGLTVARGTSGDLTLTWTLQEPPAGQVVAYDASRGDLAALLASGFPAAAVCAATELPSRSYIEPATTCPAAPGSGCWYLVRASSNCGPGTFGETGQVGDHPLDGPYGPCP